MLGDELPDSADAPLDVRTAGTSPGEYMVQQQRRPAEGLTGAYDDRRKKRASQSRSRSRNREL